MNDYTATKSTIFVILAVLSFGGSVLNPLELLAAKYASVAVEDVALQNMKSVGVDAVVAEPSDALSDLLFQLHRNLPNSAEVCGLQDAP